MRLVKENENENEGTPPKPTETGAIPEFYTNTIYINVSPFEMELQNLLMDSQQNVKGGVSVRMSPQTAWTLYKSLEKQIRFFENNFGPIALPEAIKKQFEE